MKFCFGDIVVVDNNLIGVIVKSWISGKDNSHNYDVYVRMRNAIVNYPEEEIQRYMVRHKYLDDTELKYQNDVMVGR